MSFALHFSLILLFRVCFGQSTSSVNTLTSTSPTAVTVTATSTLAIIILPSSNSSALVSSTVAPTSILASTRTSSSRILLPTNPYTGQSILTGTCNIPQYTGLALQDGAVIEVPLVGCSDDRPECCPSLSPPESTITASTTGTTGLSATGVISMLSASPLTMCPSGFIDIEPVCCPSGYRLYGQPVVGNTPCYSILSTVIAIPSAVSNSITSAVAQTASAKATMTVIINQVFALGLPCADQPGQVLSTGAKADIGVGAGVGGLLLIAFVVIMLVCIGKKRLRQRQSQPPDPGYYQPRAAHMSASTGAISAPVSMSSPYMSHLSSQSNPLTKGYGFPPSPAFGPPHSHSSWGPQSAASYPPQYRPPVEMQVPQTHEIADGDRALSSRNPDMISSEGSHEPTSSTSASESQRERTE